jgi:benzoyl-CoA-dihydrodiol lyase
VSLPEVPLLGVLPGTGGLTRLIDKRRVRRDRADVVCTVAEGVRGRRALDWGLVDELAPRSRIAEAARARAEALAGRSDRPGGAGVALPPLDRDEHGDRIDYRTVRVDLDRRRALATVTVRGPLGEQPADAGAALAAGASWWPLLVARELDDAILHLRFNELALGTWVLRTEGDPAAVAAVDEVLLAGGGGDWFVREVVLALKRTLKRLDLSSRSLVALVEPGSCFSGTLLELLLAADRGFMLSGGFEGDDTPPATVRVGGMNLGPLPAANGLSRLAGRFLGRDADLARVRERLGEDLDAEDADALGLVTHVYDDVDWDDEVRLALEERASLSPDALTGLEANLRFGGPETLETKIFGRLSAWQNWVFQRPNAAGEGGALRRFGTGVRPDYDARRA